MLVVPLVYAGYLSLFREQLIGGTSFAGLDNYTRAFGDERLWQGVARVGVFFLIQVPIMLVLALAFALALDSGVLWLSRLFRLGFFVPYAVPGVVATLDVGLPLRSRVRAGRAAVREAEPGPAQPAR
jgi:multiple sugar transport system permease protein